MEATNVERSGKVAGLITLLLNMIFISLLILFGTGAPPMCFALTDQNRVIVMWVWVGVGACVCVLMWVCVWVCRCVGWCVRACMRAYVRACVGVCRGVCA